MISLNFCLSGNFFLQFWLIIFMIFNSGFTVFIKLIRYVIHCLHTQGFWGDIHCESYWGKLLGNELLLATFQVLSFSWGFTLWLWGILEYISLTVSQLAFIEILQCTDKCLVSNFERLFFQTFFLFISLSALIIELSYVYVATLGVVPQVSEMLFIFLHSFFFLSFRTENLNDLSSTSLIVSSTCSNPLLSHFSEFFHFNFYTFNSRISSCSFL